MVPTESHWQLQKALAPVPRQRLRREVRPLWSKGLGDSCIDDIGSERRKCFEDGKSTLSATVGVKNGNPQSSALCPILFTDFINGMVQRSVLCPILFTDFINGMVQRSALCPILFTDFINGVTQRSALCPILLTHFINGVAQRSALCQIPFTEKVHYVQYCLRTLLTEWPRKVRRLAFVAHVCVMP